VIGARMVMGFQHPLAIPERYRHRLSWGPWVLAILLMVNWVTDPRPLTLVVGLGFLFAILLVAFGAPKDYRFGLWPLLFGSWVIYNGMDSPQVNNIAHVVGFLTGIGCAALFVPLYRLDERDSNLKVQLASLAMAAVAVYTVVGMARSVYHGVDESGDIAQAKKELAKGKLSLHLARYQDPDLLYILRVPDGWQRQDFTSGNQRMHRWVSPMLDANITFFTVPSPQGQGGALAEGFEQFLVRKSPTEEKSLRTLSQDRRYLSGHVGGRIIREGVDDEGKTRRLFFYFVPINDTFYVMVCSVDRYHSAKYAPIFDTIAASFMH
jgi:hypothetical protein